MKKSDAIISIIIGFLNGIIFLGILKNIKVEIPYIWLLPIVGPLAAFFGMRIASYIGRKILIVLQAARFLLVGTLNTFVDLGILNILIWISGIAAGPLYSVFKGISFIIATIHSYIWNKYWTFEKKEKAPGPKEFSKFLVITAVGFFLNVGIASLVVNVIGPQFGITQTAWASVGAFTATIFAWIWNFLGSKFVVFKK